MGEVRHKRPHTVRVHLYDILEKEKLHEEKIAVASRNWRGGWGDRRVLCRLDCGAVFPYKTWGRCCEAAAWDTRMPCWSVGSNPGYSLSAHASWEAQVLEPLLPVWETQMEVWAPCFGLAQAGTSLSLFSLSLNFWYSLTLPFK